MAGDELTTLREAAEQALVALDLVEDEGSDGYPATIGLAAAALRSALAQEKQSCPHVHSTGSSHWCDLAEHRRPLTPEQVFDLVIDAQYGEEITFDDAFFVKLARAVERAHGIGGT